MSDMIAYRKEIDGLRSIAVTTVVLFHAGLSFIPGGYLGVDIFFVISGFLITLILLREAEQKSFSLVKFYERRFRRIIPALFVVTTASAIPAAFLLAPSQLEEYGRSLIATATFVSNFLFAHEVDYFSNTSELKPLLHTWSLAVEEQFYIFFPLLLAFLYPRGRNFFLGVVIVLAIVSISLAQFGYLKYPGVNFFLTSSRIWELAVGSIAAIIQFRAPQKGNNILALLGFVMIMVPMFIYGDHIGSPTLYTAVPVIGSALVILYARIETVVGRLLALPPFVGIGLISYSAYLWHQPLFAYGRLYFHEHPPLWAMLALGVAAYVLAWLTWALIENPPRKSRKGAFSRPMIFVWSLLSIVITVALGVMYAGGFVKSKVEINALLIDAVPEWQAAQDWYVDNPELQSEWVKYSDPSKINVLVVGDSHSLGTFNMLYTQQVNGNLSDYQFIRIGLPMRCLETRGEGGSPRDIVDYCMGTMADQQNPKVFADLDVLLISIRWKFKDYVAEYVPHIVAWARERNIKTVMLSNTPEWETASPVLIRQLVDEHGKENLTPAMINRAFEDNLDPTIDKLNVVLEQLITRSGALFLSKQEYACVELGNCFAVSGNMEALHTDYGHMTRAGARFFGDRAMDLGWFDPVKAFYDAPFGDAPNLSDEGGDLLGELDNVLGINRGITIDGTSGDDVLVGTDGDDTIRGLQGDDDINGGRGSDVLVGGNGNDILRSGPGDSRNRMQGGKGIDTFFCSSKVNIVRGDQDADRFIIDHERGMTTIIDFRPDQGDRIDMSQFMSKADFSEMSVETRDGRKIFYLTYGRIRLVLRNVPREAINEDAFIFSDTPAGDIGFPEVENTTRSFGDSDDLELDGENADGSIADEDASNPE